MTTIEKNRLNDFYDCITCGKKFYGKNPGECEACKREKKYNPNQKTFLNISESWNIEAKQESTDYFYNVSESKKLFDGKKYFVIGRKGTGKTAIAEHLSTTQAFNMFSEKLSFKNFPFNFLYSLDNSKYTAPNQYITIWKYLIYSCVCKLMVNNQAIDFEVRNKLKEIYKPDIKKSLERMIESWTATDFGVEVLGTGLTGKRELISARDISWIDKCNILEDVITAHIDDSKYFVIIDELDEDYREFASKEEQKTYLQLLVSLFKATQDIRANFKRSQRNILPIIFLRTDIYSLLKDSDKNKWNYFRISLDWSVEKIKRMLAHRISVASNNKNLDFDSAWNLLFTSDNVQMGNQNRTLMNKFEYITRSTQLRPRDYIQYIINCSELAIDKKEMQITSTIVKEVDDNFSDYLRDEIIDECHSVMPEINEVFEILSQIRKQTFSTQEFIDTYNSYVKADRISDQGAQNVLRMLFEFSVIGNQPSTHNKVIFKYQTVRARFNYKENIMIHRGLYKALQIF